MKVAVLTGAVATGTHVDRGAEQTVVGEEVAQPPRLGLGEQPGQQRAAEVVDGGGDGVPVAGVDALFPRV